MRGTCLILLSALWAATVFSRQIEAGPPAPKVYAYCVEMGVPGLKPRPVAELAKLLREVGFDGGGYAILTGPQLDETLRASDDAGLKVYLLQTAINRPQDAAQYDAQVPDGDSQTEGPSGDGRGDHQRPEAR